MAHPSDTTLASGVGMTEQDFIMWGQATPRTVLAGSLEQVIVLNAENKRRMVARGPAATDVRSLYGCKLKEGAACRSNGASQDSATTISEKAVRVASCVPR
jgi:hypothetical protein